MRVANLISTIKAINGAVVIPANDCWHLTPPSIRYRPQYRNQLPINNLGTAESSCRPIIDEDDKAWSAIQCASDHRPEWGDEGKLGTESCAWYASFHETNYWGIYIPYSGLLRFASSFLGITQNPNLSIQLAWDGLLAHESMHYGIDVACAQLEVISNSPIYINGQSKLRSPQGHIPDEEQVSEAAMLRFFKNLSLKKYNLHNNERLEIFDKMIQKSANKPSGYSDGIKCISPKIFTDHLNSYLYKLCHLGSPSVSFVSVNSSLELSGLVPIASKGFYSPSGVNFSECPIHVFDDTSANSGMSNALHFITQISHIEEGPGFMEKVVPKYLHHWIKTKELLGNPSYPKNKDNLDFKRWGEEDDLKNNIRVWSVRVGKTTNMRAHIDEHISSKRWVATKFGNADKMGHHKNRK
jgi:hypothetical protein